LPPYPTQEQLASYSQIFAVLHVKILFELAVSSQLSVAELHVTVEHEPTQEERQSPHFDLQENKLQPLFDNMHPSSKNAAQLQLQSIESAWQTE
jgi:hypothetical protein